MYIDDELIKKIIDVRKKYGFKLPDSIIVGTAIQEKATLVTADQEIIRKTSDVNLNIFDPLTGISNY